MAENDRATAFATTEDLTARWRILADSEAAQAKVLLDDASDKIRSRVPKACEQAWAKAHEATLRRICCAMVKRAMQQSVAGVPEGVSQSSSATGPFSEGFTWSNPDGNLWITKEELRDLGVGGRHAFLIAMGRST